MRVTGVRIKPVAGDDRLKAYAKVEFDGCFVVKNLRVVQTPHGISVAMPSKKLEKGGYIDIAHPLDKETRLMIEDAVLGEYGKVVGGALHG